MLKDITDEVVEFISDLYKENSPEFIYYVILYNIFNEFLLDVSEDDLANGEIRGNEIGSSGLYTTLALKEGTGVFSIVSSKVVATGDVLHIKRDDKMTTDDEMKGWVIHFIFSGRQSSLGLPDVAVHFMSL